MCFCNARDFFFQSRLKNVTVTARGADRNGRARETHDESNTKPDDGPAVSRSGCSSAVGPCTPRRRVYRARA